MYLLKHFSKILQVAATGLVLCLCPGIAVYAADDYLSALEAEAEHTEAGNEPAPVTSASQKKKARHLPAGKVIESGLSFDEFEGVLDTRYSGSNFLYVKLSKGKRKRVYNFYQKDNRISSLREEIVRLLSSG
jgi:hypothetical protein